MSMFETQEQVDKSIDARRKLEAAVKAQEKAGIAVQDAVRVFGTSIGETGSSSVALIAVHDRMLAHLQMNGLPERR